jgi:hypothetical protein
MSLLVESHQLQVRMHWSEYNIDVELIKNNARLGAEIAVQLSQLSSHPMHSSSGRHITIIGGAALDILAQSDSLSTDSGSSHIGKIRL